MLPTLVSVGGRGAVFVAAVASVTAVLAAAAAGAHAAVTLVPVHEVRVVGAAPTVTHPATCSQQKEMSFLPESPSFCHRARRCVSPPPPPPRQESTSWRSLGLMACRASSNTLTRSRACRKLPGVKKV